MSADAPVSPEAREAARLLRELAERPRQAIIWPMYHGGWSTNIAAAFTRGADGLDAAASPEQAFLLRYLLDNVGEAVSVILAEDQWPPPVKAALLAGAGTLDGLVTEG